MKVLVTGDREWDDIALLASELEKLPADTIIVHGAARGADRIAGAIGEALGFVVREYPADWTRYKRGAGPVRNQQMLDVENCADEPIDHAYVCHDDLASSRGTADMHRRLLKAGVPVTYVSRKRAP